MSLANCPRCGRAFQKLPGRRVCMDCSEAEEQAFNTVRDFIRENQGASIPEVAEATGVEPGMIQRFLRDGRLATVGELAGGTVQGSCSRCGAAAPLGAKLCQPCAGEMGSQMRQGPGGGTSHPGGEQGSSSRIRRPQTLDERRGR